MDTKFRNLELGDSVVLAASKAQKEAKRKAANKAQKENKEKKKAAAPSSGGELVPNPNPDGRKEEVTKDYAEQFEKEHGGGPKKEEPVEPAKEEPKAPAEPVKEEPKESVKEPKESPEAKKAKKDKAISDAFNDPKVKDNPEAKKKLTELLKKKSKQEDDFDMRDLKEGGQQKEWDVEHTSIEDLLKTFISEIK